MKRTKITKRAKQSIVKLTKAEKEYLSVMCPIVTTPGGKYTVTTILSNSQHLKTKKEVAVP